MTVVALWMTRAAIINTISDLNMMLKLDALMTGQANNFFPEEQYDELEQRLLAYAQDALGCRSLSPIWLSYYVDGCHQGLHADNPHGETSRGREALAS